MARVAFVTLAWMSASLVAATEYLSLDDIKTLAFPSSGTFEAYPIAITPEQATTAQAKAQSAAKGTLAAIYIAHTNGILDGIAIIDHVIGRTEPITFACALGADGRVLRVDVMTYREPQGGQVRDVKFLKQFVGKGPADAVRRGRDIANIGGATMSVDALTERVRYFLALNDLVLKDAIPNWLRTRASAPRTGSASVHLSEGAAAIGNSSLNIRIHHGGDDEARQRVQSAIDQALARAAQEDSVINSWRPESELAKLNAKGAITATSELMSAVRAARGFWVDTQGLFDPTVGPLVKAWKAAAESGAPISDTQLAQIRPLIGFSRVTIDEKVSRITLPPGGSLDLGGISKGLILDRCAEALAPRLRAGETAMLSFGESSMLALVGADHEFIDSAPMEAFLTVGLRHPADPRKFCQRLRLMPGQGLGCSSGVGQTFTVGGKAYSHLINPLTTLPGPLNQAAMVIAPSAAIADGLDTALCLMDTGQALKFLAEHPDIQALLWDGENFMQTPNWPGQSE